MQDTIKDKIKSAIAAGIVFLLIITAVLIIYKYDVEGETNLPFKLNKIVIGSMIVSSDNEISKDTIENGIVQNNGIYFEIKKNENYEKSAVIDLARDLANIVLPVPGVSSNNICPPLIRAANIKSIV